VMFNKFSRGGSEEEINIRLNLQPDCRWLWLPHFAFGVYIFCRLWPWLRKSLTN
jgi:hypothetical protein